MNGRSPLWRSLQYVPAHVEKYVQTAHTRGADAIILDLEDSVPWEHKARARDGVRHAATIVGQAGADVLVRINNHPELTAADIAAAVGPDVVALYAPKVESVAHVRSIAGAVDRAERQQGLPPGHTGLVLIIESAAGFLNMATLAKASSRVVAISLGSEDFALDLGMESADDTLFMPKQQVVIAAAAAGVMPLGLMGGIANFSDPDGYRELAIRSRRFGFVGASCIHPSQVPLLNEAFTPSKDEVELARRIVDGAVAAEREGRGAFSLDGKMVDAPIVRRAEKLLSRQAILEARRASLRSAGVAASPKTNVPLPAGPA
jgi:citrate lyase subunit beta/citryl-CoA lyase